MVVKSQIYSIQLLVGGIRPTQGKTLAVVQVCGGSWSFNAFNQLHILGRCMQMIIIPNQSSVTTNLNEFDEAGRMLASSYCDRIVDVIKELVQYTLLTRRRSNHLTIQCSNSVESLVELSDRVNRKGL